MAQLRLEPRQVLRRPEVALGLGPRRDRVDDAVDELLHGTLAARRADVAPEVLADHDVGRQLAPECRDLDVVLLEDHLARLVLDLRRAQLPGDLVIRVDARPRPAPLEGQAANTLAVEAGGILGRAGSLGGDGGRYSGHRSSFLLAPLACLSLTRAAG